MSRPTPTPPPPGCSPEEIAQQIAAFEKAGGKIRRIPAGEMALTDPQSLAQISDNDQERKRQKAAAAAAKAARVFR